ncbi:hypothetical protein PVAND_012553 [Polypedilum vanderplanki]|uniref:Uncharacterized protein n=1 Tax=Polypedilum vanderplanki TaxID=319348 RepID=A0A9J6CNS7_POLVA|nr:hypothetical protein PVAND_012553 [Polypedilum vanderplanki]
METFDCTAWDDQDTSSIENAIMNDGINFDVKYIGCIEITQSMKALDFTTRSLVAKECINRVCDFANIRSPKKRKVERRIQQVISTQPCMEHCGTNVVLNISSRCLQLTSIETNEIVAKHDMPNISFASGGDSSSSNFVAYVAKDVMEWRACYVLDCGPDRAQTVISTMGQAFELRYKNYCIDDAERMSTMKRKQIQQWKEFEGTHLKSDQEYYNDLPDKIPPEFDDACGKKRDRLSSNFSPIDHEYVNEDSKNIPMNNNNNSMTPFGDCFNSRFDMSGFSLSAEVQRSQLLIENWYHGPISRAQAELLLKNDGDFLVRESQGSASGQFVLSGLNGNPKHLLLIDPEGIVRTKDKIFDSITHLINYHWSNHLPIISSDSCLLLRTPVIRTTDLRK